MKTSKTRNSTKYRRRESGAHRKLAGVAFDTLPQAEKQKVWDELNAESTESMLARSKPVSAAERRAWQRAKKMGRPRLGKDGVKVISLSLEKELLRRADAYAKRNDLKRSELITQGLEAIISSKG
jgi:hypothetical protein